MIPLVTLFQIQGRMSIHTDIHTKDNICLKLVVVFEFVFSLDAVLPNSWQETHGAIQNLQHNLVLEKEYLILKKRLDKKLSKKESLL